MKKYDYSNHSQFLKIHNKLKKKNIANVYKQKFIMDGLSVEDDGMLSPEYSEMLLINYRLAFSHEALPYLFTLDGHDKNLLLFITTYLVDENCSFIWNILTFEQYADFFQTITGKQRPTWDTLRQSKYTLEKRDIICKIESDNYMLNPLIYTTNKFKKKELIKEYMKQKSAK